MHHWDAIIVYIGYGGGGFSFAADYNSAAELDCACISLRA